MPNIEIVEAKFTIVRNTLNGLREIDEKFRKGFLNDMEEIISDLKHDDNYFRTRRFRKKIESLEKKIDKERERQKDSYTRISLGTISSASLEFLNMESVKEENLGKR